MIAVAYMDNMINMYTTGPPRVKRVLKSIIKIP